MKRFACGSACLALALLIGPASAAPAPTQSFGLSVNDPIAVNADSFLADLNGDTGIYSGNVIVAQGPVKLHADKVTVQAPGGRATRMEAQGHVIVDSPSGQAVGETGVYDVAAQKLELTGQVVLTKDANVMRGNTLEVAMDTGLAHLTGGGPAAAPGQPAPPQGRVQGLFVPAPRNNSPAPAP